MAAARSAPRSEPANSHDKSSKSTLGRIVREADPAIFDKAGKSVPAPEHIIDRLDDRGRARHAGTLLTQPRFHSGKKGEHFVPTHAQALFGAQAVDLALDVEQRVNALDCLQRNRRDRRCVLSAPSIGRDTGQFEELPPCTGLAQCCGDRSLSERLEGHWGIIAHRNETPRAATAVAAAGALWRRAAVPGPAWQRRTREVYGLLPEMLPEALRPIF
jgi:hypothetical protein